MKFVPYLLQLSETDDQELPPFPPAKDIKDQNVQPNGGGAPDSGPILPVPHGIRPTLAKYRFEVCNSLRKVIKSILVRGE